MIPENNKKGSQFYNQSIEKCFKVIETIADHDGAAMGISNISKITNLDKSSVYRIINTLYALGYLNKNEDLKYCLSNNFVVIANKVLSKMDERDVINTYMKKIASRTNHFTAFTIVENYQAILVNKVEAKISLRVHSEIGRTYPLNCSAAGKVYLSLLKDEEIDNLYRKIPLAKMTAKSITDLSKLKKDLQATRDRGYSINNQEHDLYRLSIAAPVKNMNGDFLGALGISMPSMSEEEERIEEYGQYLRKMAKELSSKLSV